MDDSGCKMDDSGQMESGRHKSVHAQWMMPQHQLKDNYTMKLMTIIAERDAAIEERNRYIAEKKAALAERDRAYLQREAVMAEWNGALLQRDEFLAALADDTGISNGSNGSTYTPLSTSSRGAKHIYHHQQQQQHIHSSQCLPSQDSDASYNNSRDMQIGEAFPVSAAHENAPKGRRRRCSKDGRAGEVPFNKASAPSKKSKKIAGQEMKQTVVTKKNELKGQDLGLNQVAYDDSTMPAPGCSCTGVFRQCYKWGHGGWQSACCTMILSMYPLPVMPNKRHTRVGGRKMSGSAFSKLLSRLAAEGNDLSLPIDLKEHWAKHGTNRYITIK